MTNSKEIIDKTNAYGASNYRPLAVVLSRGEGVWVWDVEGKRYLDMLSAYSALSHGHRHPRLVEALTEQLGRLTLCSRAFHHDQLVGLYERLVRLTGLPRVLPMNTGVEAVETAIKAARKWGYTVKGVAADQAEIIVCNNNFHGRTISVISFSSEPSYREGFGPLTPGFRLIDYGDESAIADALNERTVALLVEPIQGEGGIVVPPAGYLRRAEQLCRENRTLLLVDEIQTGLGRTGRMFCYQHEGVRPDIVIVGKALGGGLYPVSAIVGTQEVMSVFTPGTHGSTFGGNPLGAAVATAALDVLVEEKLAERAETLGRYLRDRLEAIESPYVHQVRGLGLLVGIELRGDAPPARHLCEALLDEGMLCKETHERVIRLAPPLTIDQKTLDWAVERLAGVLSKDKAADSGRNTACR